MVSFESMAHDASVNATFEPISLWVKSSDDKVKTDRQIICKRVRDYFEQRFRLPDGYRVCCYFADDDSLRSIPGNRGFHSPITKGVGGWPREIQDLVAPIDPHTYEVSFPFASIIYLHGTTCRNDLALTITFAHELWHFFQYCNERVLWSADPLLRGLVPNEDLKDTCNTPIETEARIIAKEAAIYLNGVESIE
jgi:hypothetical protein